jgi:hypothetical protein
VRGIPICSALAGLVALAVVAGLSFNAEAAMARTGSRPAEYGGGGPTRQYDQYSAQGTAQRGRGDGAWDSGEDQWNGGSRHQDRDRRGDGYSGSRDSQCGQGGRWDNRDGGQQCQGRRSYRGNHGRRAHGQWARNGGWSNQGNGRNRGGCGN